MFDFYSACTQHARLVASQHPETQPAWQDAVKQHHDADSDTRPYGALERPATLVSYLFTSACLALRLHRQRPPAQRA